MSHATGIAIFTDGEVLFFEYDGTSDIVLPTLSTTYDQMKAMWRKAPWPPECACLGITSERAILYNNYGGGDAWLGTACRKCRRVTSELDESKAMDEPGFRHIPVQEELLEWIWRQPSDKPVRIPINIAIGDKPLPLLGEIT